MTNNEYAGILSKGIPFWNKWRAGNPGIIPDLKGISIASILYNGKTALRKGELVSSRGINLSGMDFLQGKLDFLDLQNADFTGANLYEADISYSSLQNAILKDCNLRKAYMSYARLHGATIINSNLNRANLVQTDVSGAIIENCIIYGISAWGIITDDRTRQRNLILTDTNLTGEKLQEYFFGSGGHYPLMVDDIEIAQFINLITNYKNLGKALTAMLDKSILLLGSFKNGGKEVLLHIAGKLREMHFLPVIFDFDNAAENNIIETVTVLAGVSRFVIVELGGPSVPAELERITSSFTRPVISFTHEKDEKQIYSMFRDILAKKEVLFMKYNSIDELDDKLLLKLKEAERLMHEIISDRSDAVLKKLAGG
jgi:hypothetical protein